MCVCVCVCVCVCFDEHSVFEEWKSSANIWMVMRSLKLYPCLTASSSSPTLHLPQCPWVPGSTTYYFLHIIFHNSLHMFFFLPYFYSSKPAILIFLFNLIYAFSIRFSLPMEKGEHKISCFSSTFYITHFRVYVLI